MPEIFIKSFIIRSGSMCRMQVKEAEHFLSILAVAK